MLLFYLSFVACCITAVTVLGENVTVNAGDAAILSCHLVKNKEDLTRITWQRRTKRNPTDTNFFVIIPDGVIKIKDELKGRVEFIGSISARNGSIRLTDVTFLDEGVYTCIFSFFPSGPSTKLLNLNVRVPPVLSVTPEVIPVASDTTEKIITACTASNAKPEAHVSWDLGSLTNVLKVQTNISVNPDGLRTTTSYLTGVASKNLNHQKVLCLVKHIALKKDLIQEYSINIHYPPQVVYILSVGGPNKTQEFGCFGDANPQPSNFIWSKHFPVTETLTIGSSLFVNQTSDSNGLYYCVASNQYGSGVASLNVQNLPSVHYNTQGNSTGWIFFGLTLLALIVSVGYQFVYQKWRKGLLFFGSARVPTTEPPPSDTEVISF